MIDDRQLLSHLQGTGQSIESLREAILSLYKQNRYLKRIIENMERQLELQSRTPGMGLEGLPLYLASFFVKGGPS